MLVGRQSGARPRSEIVNLMITIGLCLGVDTIVRHWTVLWLRLYCRTLGVAFVALTS